MSATKRQNTSLDNSNNKKRCINWSHVAGFHERIIAERQKELKKIYNDQDDRIRQLFHLENYETLIDYDPYLAKRNESEEFMQFYERYDLMSIIKKSKCNLPIQLMKSPTNICSENSEFTDDRPSAPNIYSESMEFSDENSENLQDNSLKDDLVVVFKNDTPLKSVDIHDHNYRRPTLKIKINIPSPIITHPFHVLLVKKYNSLADYMSSFLILNNEEISLDKAHMLARIEANLLNKIELAKSNGSLSKLPSLIKKSIEPIRAPDHLDHLISHAVYFSKLVANERRTNISRAKKISGMIISYFKKLFGADEKERKEEEKRIKQLAKRTSLEVKKKWKLVEKEIRRRRNEKQEEEQRKVGKLHLNRILEHSVQLLEAQKDGIKQISDFKKLEIGNTKIKSPSINDYKNDEDEIDYINRKDYDETSYLEENDSFTEKSEIKHSFTSSHLNDNSDDFIDNDFNNIQSSLNINSLNTDENIISPTKSFEDNDENCKISDERSDYSGSYHETDDDKTDTTMDSEYEEDDNNSEDDGPGLAFLYRDEEIQANISLNQTDSEKSYVCSSVNSENSDTEDYEDDQEKSNNQSQESINNNLKDSKTLSPEKIFFKETESVSVENKNQANNEFISNDKTPKRSIAIPFLLRGTLREYQYSGLEWLVGLYSNSVNGILADEMGLGKTIQTIALLSYLACEKGIWGPHLIVVPTSVILNWEMEFSKFAPGFKILTYYGNLNQRKNKRKGWYKPDTFHICITSYQLVIHDQQPFRRKKWHYLILDEAHNIKNFRSQRWKVLLNFNTKRRLLLTGTPLQNNLVELWSLLYFLMPHGLSESTSIDFANLKDFQEWFSKPIDKMIENNEIVDSDVQNQVFKLHQLLRPYLLRRLKADVEKQMPKKYEHIVYCRLSKRQRYLYDDFMSRAKTKETLASGNFLSIINCLMQLRKVCNHPDLFEIRPIVTSFSMSRSVVADFEIKLFLILKRLLNKDPFYNLNLDFLNLIIVKNENKSRVMMDEIQSLCANSEIFKDMSFLKSTIDYSVLENYNSFKEYKNYTIQRTKISKLQKIKHYNYLNRMRCQSYPIYGSDLIQFCCIPTTRILSMRKKVKPKNVMNLFWKTTTFLSDAVLDLKQRLDSMETLLQKYSCITPIVVATDLNSILFSKFSQSQLDFLRQTYTNILHPMQVRLSIAFPDKRLLQYDCGKLQKLVILLRELQAGNHRALIFTQMTRVLDILEQFLNIHGYKYLRLDGATKIEQRQILTERFNNDSRIFVFILSTRSGGLGINLTGADTVIFYDSDWNPSMDRQCQDRCHRIGQTQDVHIYRFVSEYTIEENMLLKANQKRMLDNVVIGEGYFTTDYLNKINWRDLIDTDIKLDNISFNQKNLESMLMAVEEENDVAAAKIAKNEMDIDIVDFSERSVPASDHNSIKIEPEIIQNQDIIDITSQTQYTSPYKNIQFNHHLLSEPRHIDEYMLDFLTNEGCPDEW
ncbi:hypothetical protein PORY_001380 [Pneumocystis oryctolagi]|uniref:Uncharacterized protein n=1 Tax=Pneumocystis oryctolagi TaxID=42067 RepID=A0ACB7CCJ9_9ASCO|nr:hypothetical protein PORY_001380 [Pneumocystis oryctolagi]